MSKKIVTLLLAAAMTLSVAGVSIAKSVKCEVKAVDGNTVTLECKDAGSLKAGDNVTVKAGKKAVEGC